MQQFSFDFRDPLFDLAGRQIGVQIITFENTYGIDPDLVSRGTMPNAALEARGLRWAGGQEKCPGYVGVEWDGDERSIRLRVRARHEKKVRCVKIIVAGMPAGLVFGPRLQASALPAAGTIMGWPRGGLQMPIAAVRDLADDGDGWVCFRSLDDRVREKRIAVYRSGDRAVVELIHEDAGHEMTNEVEAPEWKIFRGDPSALVSAQVEHNERAFGLQPWETRPDVPDWAREISFVAAIHMMHWSGYIFNRYDDALDILRWVCARLEGRHVLAFLPGWEGRYYWQYGHYRPHPRLGGPEGFARLVEGAHELGVHVCPMLGCNCANTGLENFEQWGANSHLRSAGGAILQGNKPDWDVARAHDTGWQAWLNPGAPGWGNRLFEESARIVEQFGVDALFYDTCGTWTNDPDHPVFAGMMRLRDCLKARFPELLVTGEHWYAPLGSIFPVSHTWSPDGEFAEVFARYNRRWLHLNTGDPSRGSTGVHEMGTNPWVLPELRREVWPTVTFVDGTIANAPDRVEQVLALGRRYAEEFVPS